MIAPNFSDKMNSNTTNTTSWQCHFEFALCGFINQIQTRYFPECIFQICLKYYVCIGWMRAVSSPTLIISEDSCAVGNGQDNVKLQIAMSGLVLRSGRQSIQFHIEQFRHTHVGSQIVFGLISDKHDQNAQHNNAENNSLLGYSSVNGYKCLSFTDFEEIPYGEEFAENDKITITIDFHRDTVEFLKNEKTQGIVFRAMLQNRHVRPCVLFVSTNACQVRICNYVGNAEYVHYNKLKFSDIIDKISPISLLQQSCASLIHDHIRRKFTDKNGKLCFKKEIEFTIRFLTRSDNYDDNMWIQFMLSDLSNESIRQSDLLNHVSDRLYSHALRKFRHNRIWVSEENKIYMYKRIKWITICFGRILRNILFSLEANVPNNVQNLLLILDDYFGSFYAYEMTQIREYFDADETFDLDDVLEDLKMDSDSGIWDTVENKQFRCHVVEFLNEWA